MSTLSCPGCFNAIAPNAEGCTPPWCPKCGQDLKATATQPAGLPSRPVYTSGLGSIGDGTDAPKESAPVVRAVNHMFQTEAPKTYTATVQIRCWKQHTCTSCGCVYRYRFERAGKAEAGQEALAVQEAEQKLVKKLNKEVDVHPCPTCGLVQPDMAAKWKILGHGAFAAVALVAILAIAVPASWDFISLEFASMILGGVTGAAALAHVLLALVNYNSDRNANREQAEAEVAAGNVELVKPGDNTDVKDAPANLTGLHALALAGVILAVPAFLAPVLLRPEGGWPICKGDSNGGITPRLIAPGDQVDLSWRNYGIQSVKGLWRGQPRVEVLNAAEAGAPPTLSAAGCNAAWGDGIRAKTTEKRQSLSLYARVAIPNAPGLADKTLRLRVTMPITYPVVFAFNEFVDETSTDVRDFALRIASAEVRETYWSSWWTGVSLGVAGSVAGGFMLVWLALTLRSRAEPSEVVPVQSHLPGSPGQQAA
jgi:hypothetical protein